MNQIKISINNQSSASRFHRRSGHFTDHHQQPAGNQSLIINQLVLGRVENRPASVAASCKMAESYYQVRKERTCIFSLLLFLLIHFFSLLCKSSSSSSGLHLFLAGSPSYGNRDDDALLLHCSSRCTCCDCCHLTLP